MSNALGINGLMTPEEWRKSQKLSEENFGVSDKFKDLLYFFSSVTDSSEDNATARLRCELLLHQLSSFEEKTKKTVIIAEFSLDSWLSNSYFFALFGKQWTKKENYNNGLLTDNLLLHSLQIGNNKLLIDFFNPIFYPSGETEDAEEHSLSSFSTKYNIKNNVDYYNYIKNNFIFIVFYTYSKNGKKEENANSQLIFFEVNRNEKHQFLQKTTPQHFYLFSFKEKTLKFFLPEDYFKTGEEAFFLHSNIKEKTKYINRLAFLLKEEDWKKVNSSLSPYDSKQVEKDYREIEEIEYQTNEQLKKIEKEIFGLLGLNSDSISKISEHPDVFNLYLKPELVLTKVEIKNLLDALNSRNKNSSNIIEVNSNISLKNPNFDLYFRKSDKEKDKYFLDFIPLNKVDKEKNKEQEERFVQNYGASYLKLISKNLVDQFYQEILKRLFSLTHPEESKVTISSPVVPVIAPPPEPTPVPEPPTPPPAVVIPPPLPPPEPKEEPKEEPIDLTFLKEDDLKLFKSLNLFLTGNNGQASPFQPWLQKDYVSNIFTKTKVLPLSINEDNLLGKKDSVLVSVSGGINSLTANIPILGQAYPTTQFLSSMEPNYQLNLIASNNMHANGLEDSASDLPNAIKRLEEINSITLRTGREYKFVPDGSSILIDSFITRLFGSFREEYLIMETVDNQGSYYTTLKKPITIESTEYRTLESNPGASAYSMRFSETNVYDAEALKEVTTNKKLKNEKLYQDVVSYALMNCEDVNVKNSVADLKENIVSEINSTDPFEWQTKYFKSWDFFKQFANKKEQLKTLLTGKNLAVTVNNNLYELATNFLDPLFEFLKEEKNTKKIFRGIFISSGFSTNDNDSRSTFSQHYYGAAVDITVPGFNAVYIAKIISQIANKKKLKLGMGVYGNDILERKERKLTAEKPVDYATVMGGEKSKTGFIHVDLRLKMLNEGKYDGLLATYATENGTSVEQLKNFDKKKYQSLTAEEKIRYEDLRLLKIAALKDDDFYKGGQGKEYQSSYCWSADLTGREAIKIKNSVVNLTLKDDYNESSSVDIFRTACFIIEEDDDFAFFSYYIEPMPYLNYLSIHIDEQYDKENSVPIDVSKTANAYHPQYNSLFLELEDFDFDSLSVIGSIEKVDNVNEIDDIDLDTEGSYVEGTSLDLDAESTTFDNTLRQDKFLDQMDELFERDYIDSFFGTNKENKKFSELDENIQKELKVNEVTNESPVFIFNVEESDDLFHSEKYNQFLNKYKAEFDEENPTTAVVLSHYFKKNKITAYVDSAIDSEETEFTIYMLDPMVTSTFTKRQTSKAAEEIKVKRLTSMICDFYLLAGVLLIEPYIYTDTKEEAQKELNNINSNFYGINVSPMYFNNLFYAITGSSLETSQEKFDVTTVDKLKSTNTKSFFYKFINGVSGNHTMTTIASFTSTVISLALVASGIGVVALLIGAVISLGFSVNSAIDDVKEAKQKEKSNLQSSSWTNLLLLKKFILDQDKEKLASYKNASVTLRALERIYNDINYDEDLVFNINHLLGKMDNAKEIWDFTKDIVKQFIIKNPIVLKYEKIAKAFSEENKGITFSLSNIINQKYFDGDGALQEKGSLADNSFINLGYAEKWLKYVLGFPYKVNSVFDDFSFSENHQVYVRGIDKFYFSYFSNLSKETRDLYDSDLLITKDEMNKKVKELEEFVKKNKAQTKADDLSFLDNINLTDSKQLSVTYLQLKARLESKGLTSANSTIYDDLVKRKTITSTIIADLKKEIQTDKISGISTINHVFFGNTADFFETERTLYINSILPDEDAIETYLENVDTISKTTFEIGYPSGARMITAANHADFVSLYAASTNSIPKDDAEMLQVINNFTLTDNIIAIMQNERIRDAFPNTEIQYTEEAFLDDFRNYSYQVRKSKEEVSSYNTNYFYEKLFLPNATTYLETLKDLSYHIYGKEYSDLNQKERELVSKSWKELDKDYDPDYTSKYEYGSLKNLFFNIPDGIKNSRYQEFANHNKVVCAYLKNLLEEIIKELLNSELFKANLSISDTENTSDSFDFGGGKNNYPDIDLPLDPGDFSSNVNLNPGFFYYESDFKDELLLDIDKRANNILKKSLKFMNDLETGFLTEDGKNLQKGELADNYVKDIIIDTQDASSSSYMIKGGEGDALKELVLGEGNASAKINFQKDSTTALNANDVAFFDIQKLIQDSKDTERMKNLGEKLKEIEDKTESIDSSFGSRTGFLNEPTAVLNFYKKYNDKGDSFFFGGGASDAEKQVASKLGLFDDSDLSNTKEDISVVMQQSGRKLFQKQFKMQKAYPTFRFFLIEEDAVESDTYFVFDDFYSFSAVKDFTVYKSKKHAADTAIIRLQNVSGVLDGTKLAVIRDVDYEMSEKKINEADAEAKAEKSNTQVIESLVLRPGVACQLRAGYSSNPKELTILLSGRIADVSWSSNGDMCEVVMQSFGVELEVRKYGSSDADSGVSELEFHSTHKLLGWCMFRNELKHFGRFKKERLFQAGINGSESKEIAVSKESYLGTPPGYSDSMFQFFQSNWGWFVIADVIFSIGTVFIGGAGGVAKEIVKDVVQEGIEEAAKVIAKEATEEVAEKLAVEAAQEGAEAIVTEAAKTAAKTSTKASFVSKAAQYLATSMSFLDNVFTGSKWYSKMILSPFRWAFGSGWNPGRNTKIINEVIQEVVNEVSSTTRLTGEALEAAVKESLVASTKTSFFSNFRYYIAKSLGFNVAYKGTRLDRILAVSPKHLISYFQKAGVNAAENAAIINLIAKEASSKFTAVYAGRTAFEAVSLGAIKSAKFSILALGIGAGIDLVSSTVSATTNYLSDLFTNTLNPYAEKIALSPQDDAIYAPHPDRYIKPVDQKISTKTAEIMKKVGVAILNALSMYQTENDIEVLQKNIILGRTLAMDKRMYSSIGENIFKLKNHTVWEVFHEMSLRHPGWVYGARQYGTGLEYRMFFGLPNQRYFGAPLNNRTIYRMNDIIKVTTEDDVAGMKKLLSSSTISSIDSFLSSNIKATDLDNSKKIVYKMLLRDEWNRVTNKRFIPFRNYHLVSSKFNLVANNIKGVNNDVINEVAVLFVNNSSTENPEYTQRIIRSHENIPEDQIHGKAIKYDNCKGFNSALRYGTAELMNAAKEMYAGEIIILGNPEINPYDVILLDDQYSEMYGPIEVESVTHMFGMDTGFITEIKPNALVTANEGLTYPVVNSVIMYDVGRELAEKSPFDFANVVKNYRTTGNDNGDKIKNKLTELIDKWFEKEVGVFNMFGAFPNTINIGVSDYLKLNPAGQKKIKENIRDELMKQIKTNNIVLQAELLNPNASIDSLVDTSAITGLLTASAAVAIAATVKFGSSKLPAVFFAALAGFSGGFNSVVNKQLQTPDSLLANKLIPGDMLVSQVADGNLIQIFPLVKNNKPLIYGGYDKINAKRRIKNKFGNIFSDFSESMETFNIMLKEYANKENIIYSEPNFVSEVKGTLSDVAQTLLPFKLPPGTLRGYVNSYTPDEILNSSLK